MDRHSIAFIWILLRAATFVTGSLVVPPHSALSDIVAVYDRSSISAFESFEVTGLYWLLFLELCTERDPFNDLPDNGFHIGHHVWCRLHIFTHM